MSAQDEYLDKLIQKQGDEIERLKVALADAVAVAESLHAGNLQRIKILRSLGNCYMTAKRELRRLRSGSDGELIHDPDYAVSVERWQHIIRFCEESGCKSDFLRAALPTELTDGETDESSYCDDCRTYHTGECPTVRIPRPREGAN